MNKAAKPKRTARPVPVRIRQAEEQDKDLMVKIMDACWEATWVPFMPPAVPARYRNENLGRAFIEKCLAHLPGGRGRRRRRAWSVSAFCWVTRQKLYRCCPTCGAAVFAWRC